jgi:hypothetical protein
LAGTIVGCGTYMLADDVAVLVADRAVLDHFFRAREFRQLRKFCFSLAGSTVSSGLAAVVRYAHGDTRCSLVHGNSSTLVYAGSVELITTTMGIVITLLGPVDVGLAAPLRLLLLLPPPPMAAVVVVAAVVVEMTPRDGVLLNRGDVETRENCADDDEDDDRAVVVAAAALVCVPVSVALLSALTRSFSMLGMGYGAGCWVLLNSGNEEGSDEEDVGMAPSVRVTVAVPLVIVWTGSFPILGIGYGFGCDCLMPGITAADATATRASILSAECMVLGD